MIEPAVRTILVADAGVTARAAGRVYLGVGPQNERRARVVVGLVSNVGSHAMEGAATHHNGLLQVDCLAPTYPEAKRLAAAVDAALDGFAGVVEYEDGEGEHSIEIGFLEVDDQRDIPAAPLEGQAAPTFGVSIDLRFMY